MPSPDPQRRGQPDGPIRYGIIGTGMMGVEHIANIAAIDGAEVVAVADPDEGSLAAAVAACKVGDEGGADGSEPVAAYGDHHDLLAADDVDAVVVASPNMTHVDVLLDVLETDLHILVEKPLCTTVEDCRRVIEAATNPAQVVQVGLEYRWMAPVARLIDELETGVIGRPRMVAMREHRFPFLVKVGDWNRFSTNTGGTLVEKCCHFFDLMNLIVGERPTRVFASGAQDVNHLDEVYDGRRSDILDNAYVIVEYPGGARACLDLCMFADATHDQEEISVVGENGKLEALIPSDELRIGRRGEHWIGSVETRDVEPDAPVPGLHHGSSYHEHVAFLNAITTGNPTPVTLDDGLWSVAVGVAAHRSIDEGRPVWLEEVLG
ncbi:MAG: Gfo/Idh/MocA family oxidoreductase [Actinomycetota bacterium]